MANTFVIQRTCNPAGMPCYTDITIPSCTAQSCGARAPGRGRNGRQVELCVAEEELWVPLEQDQGCVLQVVMSAERLEEGLGLAPGQLPQSLVDGKELVLLLVSGP